MMKSATIEKDVDVILGQRSEIDTSSTVVR